MTSVSHEELANKPMIFWMEVAENVISNSFIREISMNHRGNVFSLCFKVLVGLTQIA
jgi:hypothetical protein